MADLLIFNLYQIHPQFYLNHLHFDLYLHSQIPFLKLLIINNLVHHFPHSFALLALSSLLLIYLHLNIQFQYYSFLSYVVPNLYLLFDDAVAGTP